MPYNPKLPAGAFYNGVLNEINRPAPPPAASATAPISAPPVRPLIPFIPPAVNGKRPSGAFYHGVLEVVPAPVIAPQVSQPVQVQPTTPVIPFMPPAVNGKRPSGATYNGVLENNSGPVLITPQVPQPVQVTPTPPFYAVNYFPKVNGGFNMWINYSSSITRTDFAAITGMGFTGIRCFLNAKTGAFDFPQPTASELANLQDFYIAARAAKLQLHITFFDIFSNWGQIAGATTWLTAVITALKGVDPLLGGIKYLEVRNELLTSATYNVSYSNGFDGGWPSGIPHPSVQWTEGAYTNSVMLVFAQQMTILMRQLTNSAIPVTISMPNGQFNPADGSHNGSDGLGVYFNASNGTNWQPDFYSYHCYSGGNVSTAQTEMNTVLAIVGGNPANLRVGEFGDEVSGSTSDSQRNAQAAYATAVRNYIVGLGIAEPQWWQFYDMPPGTAQFSTGQYDGLVDVNGNDTATGTYLRGLLPTLPH